MFLINIENRRSNLQKFNRSFTGASCEFTGFPSKLISVVKNPDFGLSGRGLLHNDTCGDYVSMKVTRISNINLFCKALPQC